jgi:FixJ family two-component response regulator
MTQPPTVFIVDDDPLSRDSMSALVASARAPWESFRSAEEFLAQVDAERPGCLVVDLRMPGMSGIDLIIRLSETKRFIPVVLISGFASVSIAVKAMQLGAVSVIEKPYRDQELWDAIFRALELDAARRDSGERYREIQSRFDKLDAHEREILEAMVAGISNKAIAARFDLSLRTVENRRARVFKQTGTESIAELVKLVMELKALGLGMNKAN